MKKIFFIFLLGIPLCAQAKNVRCHVILGKTDEPCVDQNPLKDPWQAPQCTFYPIGNAEVALDLVNGKGTGSIVFGGETYRLTCEHFNPLNGSFSCESSSVRGFTVTGDAKDEVAVFSYPQNSAGLISGENDNCQKNQ